MREYFAGQLFTGRQALDLILQLSPAGRLPGQFYPVAPYVRGDRGRAPNPDPSAAKIPKNSGGIFALLRKGAGRSGDALAAHQWAVEIICGMPRLGSDGSQGLCSARVMVTGSPAGEASFYSREYHPEENISSA